MRYRWILFDADDTLFRFDAYAGLQRMFAGYGVAFAEQDFADYTALNRPLWVQYQNGAITALQLQQRRFAGWAQRLQTAPENLNAAFLTAMAELCAPLDGAVALLDALRGRARLGLVTNGFTALQQARLLRTGLHDRFEVVAISEQIGVAKPHPGIFAHALAQLGDPPRAQVLMVGDNPHADIAGGLAAGLHTCWVNAHGLPAPEGIVPHYEVATLAQLQALLLEETA
ncbi:pyrimidine 5'-nucleotidase [Xanthomonas graminis]|jgi:YjjG family noncanonical pyrimidine nucleotidase|uniref:Hydrolase n=1 Tax=Xanthomonas graminis pv. graminis TaxID=134874 RepID=A0A1M4IR03_9XANT|nr:pyrimidine 5'-nucleotidase [Xanthomonas translucens]EKU23541.1 Pyrimidine 5'-nucleotidase YjjG [Xanthomonas translucens pv. graminis ART-Xtg29]OAX58287.1 dUMP phosphatase [Xanthomonas translucens pv. graminis]UKE54420.1 pyrimidine 5'-nucleotidase [Xanthomonas translucens pv. graminis]WIH08893.1 pyrimidine 5'-nucleotidase [Xanthomonas translucens pv. graminis]WIH12327.1 pyrimidine 5'-nucleotidase [Xanthomonas translucens pv. graminis]